MTTPYSSAQNGSARGFRRGHHCSRFAVANYIATNTDYLVFPNVFPALSWPKNQCHELANMVVRARLIHKAFRLHTPDNYRLGQAVVRDIDLIGTLIVIDAMETVPT